MSVGEAKAPPLPSGTKDSNEACDETVAKCASTPADSDCPTDFTIEAPYKILKIDGGKVEIKASDLLGYSGGNFSWSTESSKIKLSSETGSTVTVEALTSVSSGKDAEEIKITRKSAGCAPIEKTIKVTVAKVSFAESANQKYGFDDNDDPTVGDDNHICVKKLDNTLVEVNIEGGAVGTDFEFVCDDATLCTTNPPIASAQFDLKIVASNQNKKSTLLKVKAVGDSSTLYCSLNVHVYKEKVVGVIVAKIDDKNNNYLRFPNADYAAHGPNANAKLKEAVVKYNIANFSKKNKITHVKYKSNTGVLHYDIAKGGGADLEKIQKAFKGKAVGKKVRVAIIRDMKSYYYLKKAAEIGDTELTVEGSSVFFKVGDTPPLGEGANQEPLNITAVNGNKITCDPLTIKHAVGTTIEFPAAGWSSDPILIIEGTASLDVAKWTVLHEVGHRDKGLTLKDIVDKTNFMHFMQEWTDYRLRYCPRKSMYDAVDQNQWEKIPRGI